MKSYTIEEIMSRTNNLDLLDNQKEYREFLVNFIRLHLLRIEAIKNGNDVASLPVISSLVIASSGTGKSYLMTEIAKAAGINVISVDCSSLSRSGWKGVNLGTFLYSESKRIADQNKFETSIIHFDEFDKVRKNNSYADEGNPQINLLKLFDGFVDAEISSYETVTLNTSRMSFIFSGAFSGLEDIIRERIAPKRIGFCNESSSNYKDSLLSNATTEDLFQYGITKELLGRIGYTISIGKLTEDDYKHLLNDGNGSACKKYSNLFSKYGVDFFATDNACINIAAQLNESDLGARALFPLVFSKVISCVNDVEIDTTINKIILDFSEEKGLFATYEHGERVIKNLESKEISSVNLPKFNFSYLFDFCIDVEDIADIFVDFYKIISNESVDMVRCFISCCLYYMKYKCNDYDKSLESFMKIAKTLKYEKVEDSSFDILMRLVLESDETEPEYKENMFIYYNELYMIIDHGTPVSSLISSVNLLCKECYKYLSESFN